MSNAASVPQRLNLERANVLILDGDPMSMSIVTQILAGFGAKHLHRCESPVGARKVALEIDLDLLIVEPASVGPEGHDFAPWLRRNGSGQNRFAPVLIVTGHTQLARISAARDSGANFVVAKPLTPIKLMQRIQWLARDKRAHIDCPAYAGPERRFKFAGPPPGIEGRRAEDLSAHVGAAVDPNMSQADIDAMMQPRRIQL